MRFTTDQVNAHIARATETGYHAGVLDTLAVVKAHGVEEAELILNRSWGKTIHTDGSETPHAPDIRTQVHNMTGAAKHARGKEKQRARDEALVSRIAPLLEKRFQKVEGEMP